MNENARKWVEALRSGTYTQAVGSLRDGNGFCCLGVACDIYAHANPQEEGWVGTIFRTGGGDHRTALPFNVQSWLGVATPEGEFGGMDPGDCLTLRNDDGASFAAIADIIESEPEGLFGPVIVDG